MEITLDWIPVAREWGEMLCGLNEMWVAGISGSSAEFRARPPVLRQLLVALYAR
jgi:hypothetical protein